MIEQGSEKHHSPLILTIDDEKYIRESFKAFLEDYDFRVIEAENGKAGLRSIEEFRPDAVLVDLRMPEMDGLELMEKASVQFPSTPIVVISGAGEIKDVVKALHLGAWDYLMKPIKDLDILIHTLKRVLERKQLIDQNKEYQNRLEEKVKEQTEDLAHAHQELVNSEKQYRTIVETATEGILIIRKNRTLELVTDRAAGIFGYSSAEMVNRTITEFVNHEFTHKLNDEFEKLMSGKGSQFDLKFEKKDGSELWCIVSTNPIFDEFGKVSSGYAMLMDITARKKAETELELHKRDLERLVADRTEELEKTHRELVEKAHKAGMADIATNIVHNVGNVLNSVKTSAHVVENLAKNSLIHNFEQANNLLRENLDSLDRFLTEDPRSETLLQYYLKIEEGLVNEHKKIEDSIKRLIEMIDAIADIVSAQQTYTNVDWLVEEVELEKTINDALIVLDDQIAACNIKVIKKINQVPKVAVQKIKLLHTLINLIKNSAEAMDMTTHEDENRLLCISLDYATKDRNSIEIKFTDTGPGIKQENLERIFSYGFTTKKGRHGLGLHSCANYMTEMGGRIWAENNKNDKGSTFTLKFHIH